MKKKSKNCTYEIRFEWGYFECPIQLRRFALCMQIKEKKKEEYFIHIQLELVSSKLLDNVQESKAARPFACLSEEDGECTEEKN